MALAAPAAHAQFAFTPLGVPGASFTDARGINDAGQIVGSYVAGTVTRGFLYSAGAFTTFALPGAYRTEANGISATGQIVGSYHDARGYHGFLLDAGTFTMLDAPGSPLTFAHGVNAAGHIVGRMGFPRATGFLATPTTVPEPGTLALVAPGLGVVGSIGGAARRRQRRTA